MSQSHSRSGLCARSALSALSLTLLLAACLALLPSAATCATLSQGRVRVSSSTGITEPVDIILIDQAKVLFKNVKPGRTTKAKKLATGNYQVGLTVPGSSNVLATATLVVQIGAQHLLAATFTGGEFGAPSLTAFDLPSDPVPPGNATLMFMNFLPDAGPFSLAIGDHSFSPPLSYLQISDTTVLAGGTFTLLVKTSSAIYAQLDGAKLSNGKRYAAVLSGTDNSTDTFPVTVTLLKLQ